VFENRTLSTVFNPKGQKSLIKEHIRNFTFFACNKVFIWPVYIALMMRNRCTYKILVGKSSGTRKLEKYIEGYY
jgi:hypothetical protein